MELMFLQETFTLAVLLTVVSAFGLNDYCEGEIFVAKCEPDEVVVMTNASYGRMNLGKCLRVDYGNIGCSSNVLSILDAKCSGRRGCEVRVSSIVDLMRAKPHPCSRDLRSYLEATYKCVKVGPSSRPVCGLSAHMVLNSTSGYLASVVTEETQAGSIRCPWVIKGQPGQRINITMYDFALSQTRTSSSQFIEPCSAVYATVKESGIVSTERICNGYLRTRQVYTSFTDTVEVRVFTEEESESRKYFLLHYNIVGCADMKPPPNSIINRERDKIRMRCNGSSQISELTCIDSKWTGDKLVCPASVNAASSTDAGVGETLWQFITGRHEFSIVIIASVAIIIASAVLTVGLLCIKRRRENMIRLAQRKYEEGSIYYAESRKGDPRVMSHNVQGMPGDPYTTNENDYFRTWQLQRHAQARTPIDMDYPSNTVRTHDDSNKFGFGYGHVDHIYESPKFDRRDVQYFELDPSVCHQGDTMPCPIPENSARNYPLPAPPR